MISMFRPIDQQHLPHLIPLNQDLKSTISAARPIYHKSITTFSSLREDIRSDLLNVDKVMNSFEKILCITRRTGHDHVAS